jgi:two-component system sensor histidine kinase KdpD
VRRRPLPRRPPPALGLPVALALVAAETLLLYALEKVAAPVSLGVVHLLGVLVVSIGWGAALGIATSVISALAFNFFHIPPDRPLHACARRSRTPC